MECRHCMLAQEGVIGGKNVVVCFLTQNYRFADSIQGMDGIIYGCPHDPDFIKRYSAEGEKKDG